MSLFPGDLESGKTTYYLPKLNIEKALDKANAVISQLPTASVFGVKHDQDKLPYDLIPPELMESVAKVLQFGAKKYAPRNWEKGMDWSRVFSALQRHSWAWWKGEDKDPETGFSHLEHAACCIAFLLAYEQREVGKDDRV